MSSGTSRISNALVGVSFRDLGRDRDLAETGAMVMRGAGVEEYWKYESKKIRRMSTSLTDLAYYFLEMVGHGFENSRISVFVCLR